MDNATFEALTVRHSRELHLHCYRMLGSFQEAEDVLQETLLAAWRARDEFRGQASPRTWLYRIATNRSLDALRRKGRRPQTEEMVDRLAELPTARHRFDVPWLDPYPDSLLEGVVEESASPDAVYEWRETISLAFVVALQQLSPRQRGALILRDVLGFSAAESAAMLGVTVPSVTSALNRARRAMAARQEALPEGPALPDQPSDRRVLAEFVEAFEQGEVEQVVSLLTEDATFAMPPTPLEYRGAEEISVFLRDRFLWRGAARLALVPTWANGEAAFGCYLFDPISPIAWGHGLLVVGVRGGRVAALTRFLGDSVLPRFDLPAEIAVASLEDGDLRGRRSATSAAEVRSSVAGRPSG